jgi:large subunit ribosomal protein L29
MARKGKRKKGDDLLEMSDEDLKKEMDETYRQLFTARLQLATRQLANTSIVRKSRRKVARIKTIQRQREIAAAQPAAEGGA